MPQCNLTMPRCNLTMPRCKLTMPRCKLTMPRCKLTIPRCNLTIPRCNLTMSRCNLTMPRCKLTISRCKRPKHRFQAKNTLLDLFPPFLYFPIRAVSLQNHYYRVAWRTIAGFIYCYDAIFKLGLFHPLGSPNRCVKTGLNGLHKLYTIKSISNALL